MIKLYLSLKYRDKTITKIYIIYKEADVGLFVGLFVCMYAYSSRTAEATGMADIPKNPQRIRKDNRQV